MGAARQGQEACVQALLRAKANTELLDNGGLTALQHAKMEGHMATAVLIRQHAAPPQPAAASPAAPPDAGEPAVSSPALCLPIEMFDSAWRGELPKVVEWLDKGGLVDACYSTTEDGETTTSSLLHAAATNNHLEMVRMLLKRGASVDLQTNLGDTALMKAASYDHLSTVLVLLQHSANPDLQNNNGFTALIWAALEGREACVKALLRAETSPAALQRLVEQQRRDVTVLQLAEAMHTAMQCAEASGYTAIAELIRQHTAPAPPQPDALPFEIHRSAAEASCCRGEPPKVAKWLGKGGLLKEAAKEVERDANQASPTQKAKVERDAAATRRRDAAAMEAREAEAKRVAKAEASMTRRQKQAEESDQRRALMAESERLQLAQSQLAAAERSKALEERRAEQAAAEAQRESAEERACKEEKRRRAEAKVAAKEAKAREELVIQQEAQMAAARELEAQAARDREAAAERQRVKAEAQRRSDSGKKARRHQNSQQARAGRTDREPRCTSASRSHALCLYARATATPPPNAVLGDALALALNQHAGRNPPAASERAPTEPEDLEEMLVRHAIALTSSLRVEAPVFVPLRSTDIARKGGPP